MKSAMTAKRAEKCQAPTLVFHTLESSTRARVLCQGISLVTCKVYLELLPHGVDTRLANLLPGSYRRRIMIIYPSIFLER